MVVKIQTLLFLTLVVKIIANKSLYTKTFTSYESTLFYKPRIIDFHLKYKTEIGWRVKKFMRLVSLKVKMTH